ncbi:SDR family oxidoreductase, partial [Nocardia sp. NPDC060220]|uniref:SDR family oxidoreductase n=1 Tax=Nocardia sp. NPDC060220 TaxID=3347076 RepID=UPI003649758B
MSIRTAVVTGASSGIGEATARELAKQGYHVYVGARRFDRVQRLAEEIGGTAIELDVTSEESVRAFTDSIDHVDVLVNNAGGAKGMAAVTDADLDDWRWMWETG